MGYGRLAENKMILRHVFLQFIPANSIVMLGLMSQKWFFTINSNLDKSWDKQGNHFEWILSKQHELTLDELAELKSNMDKCAGFSSENIVNQITIHCDNEGLKTGTVRALSCDKNGVSGAGAGA